MEEAAGAVYLLCPPEADLYHRSGSNPRWRQALTPMAGYKAGDTVRLHALSAERNSAPILEALVQAKGLDLSRQAEMPAGNLSPVFRLES